jgi:predicted aspartyl protease
VISGIVTNRHATLTLTFLLPNGSSIPIEFVIDTGFTGELCLPLEREVLVIATGRRPLLGTALLDEQELVIQFTEGGLVTIDEL